MVCDWLATSSPSGSLGDLFAIDLDQQIAGCDRLVAGVDDLGAQQARAVGAG